MGSIPLEGKFDIVSLNVSEQKGTRKKPVEKVLFVEALGVESDAHAGAIENRQVSLLAIEDIEAARLDCAKARPGALRLEPGDFAENVTTRGVDLPSLPLGTKLHLGEVLLEISKIGKECHAPCEIRRLVGSCVMPTRGVFARVIRGGEVSRADRGYYRIG